MKQFFLALMITVIMLGSAIASATGLWGMIGGIGVQIGSAEPLVTPLDGREIFTDEIACNTALTDLLKSPVTKGTSNTGGDFATTVFNKLQVSKINMAKCVKTGFN